MRILGLDLGTPSTKTAAALLSDSGEIRDAKIPTTAESIHDLLLKWRPDRVVCEPCHGCGWVIDLVRGAQIEVQVVNPRDPAWQNRRTAKTDRSDALLLARLSLTGQVRTVVIPDAATREWRALIEYRTRLVAERTRIKNHLKAILRRQGMVTRGLWTEEGMERLSALARPLADCSLEESWRGQIAVELQRLEQAQAAVRTVTDRLNAQGASDAGVRLLTEQVDGVGPRLAEAAVAFLGDPRRFRTGRQVGAYAGLATRVWQSGAQHRSGGITHTGNPTLRALLIEVAWLGCRRVDWMREAFTRISRGDPARRKKAVTAVARRLLIRIWATLRDGKANPHPVRTAA